MHFKTTFQVLFVNFDGIFDITPTNICFKNLTLCEKPFINLTSQQDRD